MGILIEDGFTLSDTITGTLGTPDLCYRYRPALPEDAYGYLTARADTGKQRMAATLAVLEKHLVSWDATDRAGDPVPLTPRNIARVPVPILERMLNVVIGYAKGQAAADEKNS